MDGILFQQEVVIDGLSTNTKPGRVTIAGNPNEDLAPGTLNSIIKQAGIKPGGN
jgi:hypothetical protein